MKTRLFLFALVIFAISLVSAISSAQRKPESETPIKGDFKITIKQTTAGQPIQSTTMIKGLRERNETSINAGAFTGIANSASMLNPQFLAAIGRNATAFGNLASNGQQLSVAA